MSLYQRLKPKIYTKIKILHLKIQSGLDFTDSDGKVFKNKI